MGWEDVPSEEQECTRPGHPRACHHPVYKELAIRRMSETKIAAHLGIDQRDVSDIVLHRFACGPQVPQALERVIRDGYPTFRYWVPIDDEDTVVVPRDKRTSRLKELMRMSGLDTVGVAVVLRNNPGDVYAWEHSATSNCVIPNRRLYRLEKWFYDNQPDYGPQHCLEFLRSERAMPEDTSPYWLPDEPLSYRQT